MNYIKRDKCVVTGKEDLEPLYSLIDFPIFIGCTEQDQVDIIMRNEVFFHSHVLEHLYNPLETMSLIAKNQNLNNKMIFSFESYNISSVRNITSLSAIFYAIIHLI